MFSGLFVGLFYVHGLFSYTYTYVAATHGFHENRSVGFLGLVCRSILYTWSVFIHVYMFDSKRHGCGGSRSFLFVAFFSKEGYK